MFVTSPSIMAVAERDRARSLEPLEAPRRSSGASSSNAPLRHQADHRHVEPHAVRPMLLDQPRRTPMLVLPAVLDAREAGARLLADADQHEHALERLVAALRDAAAAKLLLRDTSNVPGFSIW